MHARSVREEAAVRRIRLWGRAQPIALRMDAFNINDDASSVSSITASDANFSRYLTSQFNVDRSSSTGTLPPDPELLRRARAAHMNTDFSALAEGPGQGGPWQCVETVGRFSVFRRQDTEATSPRQRPEVLCAGSLDASLDEVARILCPSSEAEHKASMEGLYAKNFIFGTMERNIECVRSEQDGSTADTEVVDGEQLAVKTSSFVHTTVFGHNEQWCYVDFFQRKSERDGFTISQRAIRPEESTSGCVTADHARVHQMHGLTALYLVDQLPERKGLRVVFHSWFDPIQPNRTSTRRSGRRRSVSDSAWRAPTAGYCSESKAQTRRLLALARGVAQLPVYVRHRRFSIQVPSELDAVQVDNPRCPCCTCSLSTVKLTLTGLPGWKRLKKKRCYLCGYLVCGACWSAAQMETDAGRVASIISCTRCQACLEANRHAEFESFRIDRDL